LSDTNNEETKKQSAEEVARQKNPATDCSNPRRKKGEAAEAMQSRKTPRRGGRQQPHHSLKKIQEVPHDGGAISPKDA
jgi:hypothetical protein